MLERAIDCNGVSFEENIESKYEMYRITGKASKAQKIFFELKDSLSKKIAELERYRKIKNEIFFIYRGIILQKSTERRDLVENIRKAVKDDCYYGNFDDDLSKQSNDMVLHSSNQFSL